MVDNTIHCLCHKPLEVSRTRLHQHSGGTGSAPASYLPQLAGGCVALGTSASSGAGGPWYNYQGGITGTASGPLSICPFFVHLCMCVCVCVCVCVCIVLNNSFYLCLGFVTPFQGGRAGGQ